VLPKTEGMLNDLQMPNVGKVLVPVDFSEHSDRALTYATGLAKGFGATLHLVHVYPASAYIAPPLLPGPVIIGQFRDQSQKAFDEFLERARRDHCIEITGTLLEGVPHVEILRLATELQADLIVMGTHGRTGIEHLLLGSIAERVVRSSEVPVITVPRAA
jgi:nucleotide-binding universal stress UspA family protein